MTMWMRFSEHVGKMIFRGDRLQIEATVVKIVMNKVGINLNVFDALLENIDTGNVCSTLIVAVDLGEPIVKGHLYRPRDNEAIEFHKWCL